MNICKVSGFALAAFAAAWILAGCAGSADNGGAGMLPGTNRAPSRQPGRSWMRAGAASGDLMYVADVKDNEVEVYTYPAGTLAGTLTGFKGLAYMCVDGKGHVFIPSYGAAAIFEYAHGGTSPIRTLNDPRAEPYSCSIDPKTGNLAAANYLLQNSTDGNVVIYQHAKGRPFGHLLYGLLNPYFCAYDNAGDLFVSGSGPVGGSGYFSMEELVRGARLFSPVTLQNVPAYPNGLQWDGNYLAVGTGTLAGPSSGDTYIYRMRVSNFLAKTIGTARLKENGPTANFFVDGSTILVSGGETQPNVALFNYPAGGAPTQTYPQTSPSGVVVSHAATPRNGHAGPPSSSYQYATIFSFEGFNGAAPAGTLLSYKGKLYGTTTAGGYYAQGTIFSVSPSGVETVLHNFGHAGDGTKPEAGLTVLNGVLYGTTYSGGTYNDGTVFSITTGGKESVLYNFGRSKSDGKNSAAALTPLNGTLYGTTPYGGTASGGTVFSISPTGSEKVIFDFPSYSKKDGDSPFAGLIAYNGTLYGTTEYSGPCQEGTAYSITTAGKEKTIYGFPCQRYDGENPKANLVVVNGVLYGTTSYGGKAFYNDGTVFSLTLSGQEQVLFDFIPSSEYGYGADTALVPLKGMLYGTTPGAAANGLGAIYGVTTTGQPTVLHSFGIAPDGSTPLAGVTNVGGTLYGTTSAGGGPANAGTIYRITP